MKSALLRSALIGIVAAILIILLAMVYVDITFGRTYRLMTIAYAVVFNASMAKSGLFLLFLIIALVTWWQTRHLSKELSASDAKKQLMISVWVSTAVAASPILLSVLVMFREIFTNKGNHEADWLGLIVGAIVFTWNVFLIFIVGLIARLMVKNDKPKEISL